MVRLLRGLIVIALFLAVVVPAAAMGFAWWDASRMIARAESEGLLPPEGETVPFLTTLESVASASVFGATWDVKGAPCRTGARFWLHYTSGGDDDGLSISQVVARDINAALEPDFTLRSQLRELGLACLLEHRNDDSALLRAWLAQARFADGETGADAAAQALFNKPAASLDARESARLIALLYVPGARASESEWSRLADVIAGGTDGTPVGAAAVRP